MKKLYIFRGLPGTGKSTIARTMAPLVVEPDMFRYTADNEYVFDSDKNAEVMKKTEDLLAYAAGYLRMPCLAVTATHVKLEHIEKYVRLGHDYGYTVAVVECYGSYGSIHNVPDAIIAKMAKEFEPLTNAAALEMGVSIMRFTKDTPPRVCGMDMASGPAETVTVELGDGKIMNITRKAGTK